MLEGMSRGEKKGLIIERRFRRGMERQRDKGLYPEWLGFITAADPHEDIQGIDMWAYTDVGKIPLQIKGSEIGRALHEQRHNRAHIACIVVPINKPFDEVFSEAVEIIASERAKILERKAKMQT